MANDEEYINSSSHARVKLRPSVRALSPRSTAGSIYHLDRHVSRSVLTLLGPFAVLGYFVFICVEFLGHPPPDNNIIISNKVNGGWIFYAWFVVSVLMLDWARTGFANIEACALMDQRLAPVTAAHLMWHADANWANPLWWVRALLAYLMNLGTRSSSHSRSKRSVPGRLWIMLSLAMASLIFALPLSGLAIQTTQIKVTSKEMATIYGPNQTSFQSSNGASSVSVRNMWQTGRQTTPQQSSLFYAPSGTANVSNFYFNDMAAQYAPYIESFLGPEVPELVSGRVWGIWSNISCQPTSADQLQLIQTNNYDNVSVNVCATFQPDNCTFAWMEPSEAERADLDGVLVLPLWLYENGTNGADVVDYSLTVAADGFNRRSTEFNRQSSLISPYYSTYQHDNSTLDHLANRSVDALTVAMIEVHLWESREFNDPLVDSWIVDPPNGLTIIYQENGKLDWTNRRGNRPWAGVSLHCDVKSAFGFANLDPGRRQFSNFSELPASWSSDANVGYYPETSSTYPDTFPLQVVAASSISAQGEDWNDDKILTAQDPNSIQSAWAAIQGSISLKPFDILMTSDLGNTTSPVFPMLGPDDLKKSMYKLLGESMITYMQGSIDSWQSQTAHSLGTSTYIVSGPIPWQYVVALLTVWVVITSGGAVWMLTAGPRWAPALSGFEMFKFGAQYSEELNEMTAREFRECATPLDRIPGRIGLLHGHGQGQVPGSDPSHGGTQDNSHQAYFIGLSENSLGPRLRNTATPFTFDRRAARLTRW